MKWIKLILFYGFLLFATGVEIHRYQNPQLIEVEVLPEKPVAAIQQMLTDLNDQRYDPGPIDNVPGPQFRRAYLNYEYDFEYAMPIMQEFAKARGEE